MRQGFCGLMEMGGCEPIGWLCGWDWSCYICTMPRLLLCWSQPPFDGGAWHSLWRCSSKMKVTQGQNGSFPAPAIPCGSHGHWAFRAEHRQQRSTLLDVVFVVSRQTLTLSLETPTWLSRWSLTAFAKPAGTSQSSHETRHREETFRLSVLLDGDIVEDLARVNRSGVPRIYSRGCRYVWKEDALANLRQERARQPAPQTCFPNRVATWLYPPQLQISALPDLRPRQRSSESSSACRRGAGGFDPRSTLGLKGCKKCLLIFGVRMRCYKSQRNIPARMRYGRQGESQCAHAHRHTHTQVINTCQKVAGPTPGLSIL